jgi:hypothetical protein
MHRAARGATQVAACGSRLQLLRTAGPALASGWQSWLPVQRHPGPTQMVTRWLSEGSAAALAARTSPQFRNGRWQKPRISAKNLARMRRQALVAGEAWALERPVRQLPVNPVAGRRHILRRPDRHAEVQERLDRMPEIIEEYRQVSRVGAPVQDSTGRLEGLHSRLLCLWLQYLIKSKTSAYEKRELHVYFDAELVRRLRRPIPRHLSVCATQGEESAYF